MTPLLSSLSLCLCVLFCVTVVQGQMQTASVDQPTKLSLRSVEDQETTLPCHHEPKGNDVVVQVTWSKVNPDGSKDQMITAHFTEGQTTFGPWSQRVRFQNDKPTVESSLIILSTRVSDEGEYICRISTFPTGNFDTEISLVVWTIPISSVDPVVVVEGELYKQVASCRSVGHPPPKLSWDTELNGQVVNRSSDNGAVSTHFSLYPDRNLNGKKLDCLVWHPLLPSPRRIENQLVVHFPPHAEVSGYKEDWTVGMENAALRCINGGNPKPVITWTRAGGALPKGTQVTDDKLVFMRPLNFSDGDAYECMAKNKVGETKATVKITLEVSGPTQKPPVNNMMIYVGAGASGLFILMMMIIITLTCHHKRKKKKLKKELSKKTEECILYRQASIRRVNSVHTEKDVTEENIPLRVEGTLRTSLSSLGEMAHCRDSRSTISCGRERGAYDSLGRPALSSTNRRGRILDRDEETRLRVETFVKNSNMSLESRYHPPLTPSTFPAVHQTEALRHMNGNAIMPADGGSRPGSVTKSYQAPPMSCTYPPVTDDEDEVDEGLGGPASQEHPDDQDSEHSSLSDISKLRKSPPIINPHMGLIHKAHIV